MFSEFSRADWWRLGLGLCVAASLVAFAGPIASTVGTTRSVPLLFAALTFFVLLTGVIELVARNNLSRRAKHTVKRAMGVTLPLLGALYFIARKQLANGFGLQLSGLDAAVVLAGAIIFLRLKDLTSEAPDRSLD